MSRRKLGRAFASRRTVLVCATVAVLVLAGALSFGQPIFASAMALLGVAPEAGPRERVVLITATPAGFNPLEVTVRPGAGRLLIRNGTGAENAQFVVTRPDRSRVLEATLGRGRRTTGAVVFTPGELYVTELSHPEWVCKITVEP